MKGYTLNWNPRDDHAARLLDGSPLRPDVLGSLSIDEVRLFALPIGRTTRPLQEVFEVMGAPGDALTLRQAPPLDRLGCHMKAGQLHIDGDAGDHLGASMTGGSIHVKGCAGHQVGGPVPGLQRGTTGGEIHVHGDAGDFTGLRMRRGLIAVAGAVGASPGYRMLAGTIVLGRGPLDHPGLELRRGSLICVDRAQPFTGHRAWVSHGVFETSAVASLSLLLRHVKSRGFPLPEAALHGAYELFIGDRLELNRGEL